VSKAREEEANKRDLSHVTRLRLHKIPSLANTDTYHGTAMNLSVREGTLMLSFNNH
jgi:hypothetical protein